MAAPNELHIALILEAVDLATKDIDGLHDKLGALRDELLKNNFQRAGDDVQAFGETIGKLASPLDSVAVKIAQLNAFLQIIGTTMGVTAYNAAVEYGDALAGLTKYLEGNTELAGQFGKELDQLALKYGQNGKELLGAMTLFASAGYTASEAIGLVENAIKLMVAGNIDSLTSAHDLIAVLKGFNLPASEAARVLDVLAAVSSKYNTNVEQLATGMSMISPIASQMGYSLEETAGILTPIIEIFGSGSEAADGLKTGLLKITDNATGTVAALSELGVSQTNANGSLRSGKDILMDVIAAFASLSNEQRISYTNQLVGIEQSARMGTVLSNQAKITEITTTATHAAGQAQQYVNTQLASSETQLKRTTESWRQLLVAIGQGFEEETTGVVQALGNLEQAFKRAIEAGDLKPLLDAIGPELDAVKNLFEAMANNLEGALKGVDFTPLANGIKDVSGEIGDAFKELTAGYDLKTLDGLKSLIQAIVNRLGNFSQAMAGTIHGIEPFIGALNALFRATAESSPGISKAAGEISGYAYTISKLGPIIGEVAGKVFNFIGKLVEIALIIRGVAWALSLLSGAGLPVGAMLTGALSTIPGLLLLLGRLPVTIVAIITSLTGLSDIMTAGAVGVGALGYGIGMLINSFAEWASGGRTIGTMLYDLTHESHDLSLGIIKNAEANEMATVAVDHHAQGLEKQKTAAELATEAAHRHNEQLINEADFLVKMQAAVEKALGSRKQESEALKKAHEATQKYSNALVENAQNLSQVSTKADAVIKGINLLDQAQFLGITGAIDKVDEAMDGAGKVLKEKLLKSLEDLDAKDLKGIIGKLAELGEQAKISGNEVSQALDLTIEASLKNLGVDSQEILTGISNDMQNSMDDLSNFKQAWTASGKSADDAGKLMLAALTKLADKANTVQEIDALRTQFVALEGSIQQGTPEYAKLTAQLVSLNEEQGKLLPAITATAYAQDKARASAASLAEKIKLGTATSEDFAKAERDAAAAVATMGNATGSAAHGVHELTDEEIAAMSVAAEKRAHNAAVAAQEMQNAQSEHAQAEQAHADAEQTIHDSEQLTVLTDDLTLAMREFGEVGKKTYEIIVKGSAYDSFDLIWKRASAWLNEAYKQVAEVENLTNRLKTATATGLQLGVAINEASQHFDHLDAQHLTGLNQALDAARQKMQALEESTKSTLEALQDEMVQLAGDQSASELRRYQQQQAKLVDQAKAARESGDAKAIANARESLKLAEKIHDMKMKGIEQEAAAERKKNEVTHVNGTPADNGGQTNTAIHETKPDAASQWRPNIPLQVEQATPVRATQQTQNESAFPSGTYHVHLHGPDGQSVKLSGDVTERDRFLEIMTLAAKSSNWRPS